MNLVKKKKKKTKRKIFFQVRWPVINLTSSLTPFLAYLWKAKEMGGAAGHGEAAGQEMGSKIPAGLPCVKGRGSFPM